MAETGAAGGSLVSDGEQTAGIKSLQSTIDRNAAAVEKISTSVGSLSKIVDRLAGIMGSGAHTSLGMLGANTGGSNPHNARSNSTGSGIGGNYNIGDSSQKMGGGGANNGGGHSFSTFRDRFSQAGPIGKAGIGTLAAFDLMGAAHRFGGGGSASSVAGNLLNLNSTVSMYNFGAGGTTNGVSTRLWGNKAWQAGAMSGGDYNAAMATGASQGFGFNTGDFGRAMNGSLSMARLIPGMSAQHAMSAQMGFYGPQSQNMLKMFGVKTVTGGPGARQLNSPMQIANQLLDHFLPNYKNEKFTAESINYLIYSPERPISASLDQMAAMGAISPDQVEMIKQGMANILKASANSGGKVNTGAQLDDLIKKAAGGDKSAKKQLKSMNIADSDINALKDQQGSSRAKDSALVGGFNEGLQKSAELLTSFNDALGSILSNTPLGGAMGAAQGVGATGIHVGRAAGGLLAGAGNGALIGSAFGGVPGAIAGGIIGGGIGLLTHMGGNDTIGMSGQGGSQGAAGGGSAAGGSGVSFGFPTSTKTISTPYGIKGPMWKWKGYHTGVDFDVPSGTPVVASASGTIIGTGPSAAGSPYGNAVLIDHGNGYQTLYAHNSRVVVSTGDTVNQGKTIAFSGASGNVTGPHVHFEIRRGADNPIDPTPLLSGAVAPSGTGSAGNSANGSGSTTSGGGTGSGMSNGISGLGSPSELSILNMGLGGGGSAGGDVGTPSSGSGGSATKYTPSGGVSQWHDVMANALKAAGLNPTDDLINLGLHQMQTESSGNPNAVNNWDINAKNGTPSKGLMQVIQPTFDHYAGKYASAGINDPMANIYSSIEYTLAKYGSLQAGWKGHGYDKGAWNIPSDEIAKVHKGEMIVPSSQAEQIRQVLLNNTAQSAGPGREPAGAAAINFHPGAIQLVVGAGANTSQAQAIGRAFVDSVLQDKRILQLQKG